MLKHILLISLFVAPLSHVSASAFRVSADELNKMVAEDKVVVLDARKKDDYDVGHVKNAISFPVGLTFLNKEVNGKIQRPQIMQKYLQERGLNLGSKIVIYDSGEIVKAARVFWTLEVYGFTNVKILDRGYKSWIDKNYSTSQDSPKRERSSYIATINHKRLASKFTTQLAIHNKNKVLVDARSVLAYLGKVSVARRFGHIPNAINVPFEGNINKNSEFVGLKSTKELKSLYGDIPVDKKVIIYCKIGMVSSTNYFALRELGYDVANYDASWREWGNDLTLPIEK